MDSQSPIKVGAVEWSPQGNNDLYLDFVEGFGRALAQQVTRPSAYLGKRLLGETPAIWAQLGPGVDLFDLPSSRA